MRGVWGYGLILRAPKPPWPLVAAKEFFRLCRVNPENVRS
jgi:hypothetical protein